MSKTNEANHVIKSHVLWVMGAGVIPLPLLDIVAVTAVQLDMIQQLNTIYNKQYSELSGKALDDHSDFIGRVQGKAIGWWRWGRFDF